MDRGGGEAVKGENGQLVFFSVKNDDSNARSLGMIVKSAQNSKKEKTSSQHLAIIGSRLLVLT